jgi:Tol biopolymer transport system component
VIVQGFAYVTDAEDHIGVFVKFLSGGETVDLTAGSENLEVARSSDVGGLDISPDGTQIMFTAGPHGAPPSMMSAYVIGAPLGGTPRKLIDRGISARWSPDGTKLAYIVAGGGAGDALAVSDANGANGRQILPAAGGVHAHWPAWSADSQFVYFIKSTSSMNGEPAEIFRVAAAGGRAEPVVTTTRRALFRFVA